MLCAATVEVELEKKPKVELRSFELDQALKKPKTTVVELRAFERCRCFFQLLFPANPTISCQDLNDRYLECLAHLYHVYRVVKSVVFEQKTV